MAIAPVTFKISSSDCIKASKLPLFFSHGNPLFLYIYVIRRLGNSENNLVRKEAERAGIISVERFNSA